MSGIMTTGSFPTRLQKGAVKAYLSLGYDAEKEIFSQIFDKVESNKAVEYFVEESAFGLFKRKTEAGPTPLDASKQLGKKAIWAITFTSNFIMSREAKDDNQGPGDLLQNKARAIGEAGRISVETEMARILAGNEAGSDGQPFFSSSHPTVGGADRANILATPAAIAALSLQDVRTALRTHRDNRGKVVPLMPKALVCSAAQEAAAMEAMQSFLDPATSNNAINAAHEWYKSVKLVANPYLDNFTTTMWFVKANVRNSAYAGHL